MSNFQLPIAYLSNKTRLEPELLADLELLDSTEESPPLYTHVLGDRGGKGKRTFDMWSQYYTSDRAFLKDHQTLLKRVLPSASDNAVTEGVNEIWSEVNNRNFSARDADGFHDKYQYIDWPSLKWLNCSSVFLACLSAYNIGSPVFSLATPYFHHACSLCDFTPERKEGIRARLHHGLEIFDAKPCTRETVPTGKCNDRAEILYSNIACILCIPGLPECMFLQALL